MGGGSVTDSLERIYRAIPTVHCKGLCAESCGPVDMSPVERRRIAALGVDIPKPDVAAVLADGGHVCPALTAGHCSVYDARPVICRLWGATQSMPCPFGCEAEPGLLMDAGARQLISRAQRITEVTK